ncbi:amidohydrolase [Leucobacter chinensis]|uniref:amidohydrolase n=1 Tax=Leucobacter chinensis TaxID=2851010 RepID=UPI001C23A75D|nr:amidohydrolase [Leucobacter chinensis]
MQYDILYTNGRFYTGDPSHPEATHIAVHQGRILALDEQITGTPKHTVDLQGARTLPGFHDAHYHLSLTGARLAALDVRPSSTPTLESFYEKLGEFAQDLPSDAWVMASGYDQNVLGAHPTAEGIDAVVGGRPAAIEHVSAHMLVANTRAFELAGYPGRAGVPEIEGGHVARDVNGLARGLLQESAQQIIHAVTRPLGGEEILRNLTLAGEQAVAYGITSITEPGLAAPDAVGNAASDLHFYQTAIESGMTLPRLTVMPYFTVLHPVHGTREGDWFGLDMGIRTGFGNEWLSIGPVKILSDGSLIGRSAAMHHCYHGETSNRGFMVVSPEHLAETVLHAHRSGWSIATHAIGDSAIDEILNAIEDAQAAYPRPEVRHRIEHFAVTSDEQVQRAAKLGVIPVPQGTFISDFGDGIREALGAERAEQSYRFASLLAAGIEVPGSTDSPVSDGNPLRSIHDMVNRKTSSGQPFGLAERITVEQAVHAYTYGSAYAVGKEGQVGTLAPGMLADFVVLNDDIFTVDPEHIADLTVTRTVIGGDTVFITEP